MSARVWRSTIVVCQSILIASTVYAAVTAPRTDNMLRNLGFSALAALLLGALWLWYRGNSAFIRVVDGILIAGIIFILPGAVLVFGDPVLDAVLIIDIAAAAVVALFAGRGTRDAKRPNSA